MQVDQEKMESALDYLASTDEAYAQAKAQHESNNEIRKVVKANCATRCGEKSESARERVALTMPDYIQHLSKMEANCLDMLTLQVKRQRAVLTVDVWRSLNAARRMAQIT